MTDSPDADATTPTTRTASAAKLDCRFLESLVGYNARRASLRLVGVFSQAVQGHALKVVEFSMLSLIKANPGITSRHLCQCLDLLPPNAVSLVNQLIRLGYVAKQTLAHDRRATGLYMTPQGHALTEALEAQIAQAEAAYLHRLSPTEQRQLIRLLQKTYAADTSTAPPSASPATPCNTTT